MSHHQAGQGFCIQCSPTIIQPAGFRPRGGTRAQAGEDHPGDGFGLSAPCRQGPANCRTLALGVGLGEVQNSQQSEAKCVAGFRPNQIENAPKLATLPVILTPNWQQIRENSQHLCRSVASFWVSPVNRWGLSAEPAALKLRLRGTPRAGLVQRSQRPEHPELLRLVCRPRQLLHRVDRLSQARG